MREQKERKWQRHLAVAALYFVGYTALRHVSFSYWFLPAGLRLFCLLYVPTRYWPALVAGEVASLGKANYDCFEQLGLYLALIKLFPPIALAIPVVHWCKKHISLVGPKSTLNMGALILCTFVLAIVIATRDYILLYLGNQPVALEWAEGYFLGNYLGVLTIVPSAYILAQEIRGSSWKVLWSVQARAAWHWTASRCCFLHSRC